MTRIRRTPRRWFAAIVLLPLLILSVLPAGAKSLDVYDLDSLVHLSTDVVEAEIKGKSADRGDGRLEVAVTAVHKGNLEAGMSASIANVSLYTKQESKPFGSLNPSWLGEGDRLVLFLTRADVADKGVSYDPLPGGMRLVSGGRCHGFSQLMNPGPYVALLPEDGREDESVTIGQLQEQIRASLRSTQEWAALLKAAPDQLDVERLMDVLKARSGIVTDFHGRDDFTEQICSRFAETHDPAILSRALSVTDSGRSILMRGFGTPEGRDWLLAKVTDANEPMPKRLLYAHALQEAGKIYRSKITAITATSWREGDVQDDGNSGYLTRIARTARQLGKEEELSRTLLKCLDYFGQGIIQNKPAPLMADLEGAFAELTEFYRTGPSEELQFGIEMAISRDPDSYEKLGSACGPLISILRPADPAQQGPPVKGRLAFQYDFNTSLMSEGVQIRASVVLIHETTSQKHVVPAPFPIEGGWTGGGGNSIKLPDNLPAGRYRIHLEVDEKDGMKSKGHSCVVEL